MKRLAATSSFFTLLVITFTSHTALAYVPSEESWRQVSEDGQYVLVMVSRLPFDDDLDQGYDNAAEIREIRARYSQSGLYRNDGSSQPLWTIPHHISNCHAYLTSDGVYLIIANDSWLQYPHAATFYADGKELSSYTYLDLVRFGRLKHLVSRREVRVAPQELAEQGWIAVGCPHDLLEIPMRQRRAASTPLRI